MADPQYGAQYSSGDIGFVLICMALVWLMIPGIGYFYSGMARSKNALSLIMCCVLSLVVVSVQVRARKILFLRQEHSYLFILYNVVVYLGLQSDVQRRRIQVYR